MKKFYTLSGTALVFIVAAFGVATVAKDRLPKTTALELTINECKFEANVPPEFDLDQLVKMSVSADKNGEFRISGFNVVESINKDDTKEFTFKAVRSGTFDAEFSDCSDHLTIAVKNSDGSKPETEQHKANDELKKKASEGTEDSTLKPDDNTEEEPADDHDD